MAKIPLALIRNALGDYCGVMKPHQQQMVPKLCLSHKGPPPPLDSMNIREDTRSWWVTQRSQPVDGKLRLNRPSVRVAITLMKRATMGEKITFSLTT